ncbi:hypothetical protein TNCT_53761 [Trichonephila clavata]|uniref:Uncharacterized protein n=1 Tax=Trichonephila clavata TaxID=2740835 RepID=A0A8X6K8U5_TRICU|nr:hypothetical protein TNCT_53761 [Trichonephila clavata]
MAAANTLLHILYSLLTLSSNQKQSTDITEELNRPSTVKPYFEDVNTDTPTRFKGNLVGPNCEFSKIGTPNKQKFTEITK